VYTILTTTSADKFHKTQLYQKFYRAIGVEDQLTFLLRHSRGVYVIVYSREAAFTEREVAMMCLLKTQLQIALKNWQRICDLEQHLRTLENKHADTGWPEGRTVDSENCFDLLTPRQRMIASLVAQGLENRAIAEELHISPKTVGKHLENIFEVLGIHHRAALAAMWGQMTQAQ
jgi:DNA-binding CsgD family transcriptional regulator